MADPAPIQAAGVAAFDDDGRIVAVHRPRRADWSLPKGKLEPGEPAPLAAVRECEEETGLGIVLDAPLGAVSYEVRGVPKQVRYWRARIRREGRLSPNDEVDDVVREPPGELRTRLSYAKDVTLVERAAELGPSSPLVVVRHGQAQKRADWAGSAAPGSDDDSARPLDPAGLLQAERLAPLLSAYGIDAVVCSPSRRCRQTVAPYAAMAGVAVRLDARLSEEGFSCDPDGTAAALRELARDPGRIAVCTHRPVLRRLAPALAAALADEATFPCLREGRLDPGQLVIVHRSSAGRAVAVEQHQT